MQSSCGFRVRSTVHGIAFNCRGHTVKFTQNVCDSTQNRREIFYFCILELNFAELFLVDEAKFMIYDEAKPILTFP